MNIILLVVLIAILNGVDCAFHNLSDEFPHRQDTVRIEMPGIVQGLYSGIDFQSQTGAFMWRDYVNNVEGGICIGGGPTYGDCPGGKRVKVSLVIWQLGEVGKESEIEATIQSWVLNISKRTDNEKPHFVLCPLGEEYTQACNYAFSINNGLSVPSGIRLLTFAGSGLPTIFEKEYEFTFSIWTSYDQALLTMGKLLSTHYNITSIGLLSDKDADPTFSIMIDYLGKYLQSKNIFILKMCSDDQYLPSGRSCTNDLQCRDDESCVYPAVKRDLKNDEVLESERLTKKWIERFMDLGLDGIFYIAYYDLYSAMNYMRVLQWTPKIAGSYDMQFSYYTGLSFGAIMDKWHILSTFDEKMEFGISGRYMGTTQDFIQYVEQNFQAYMDPNIFDLGTDDLEHNYEYISGGASSCVVIQRLLEITTTHYNVTLDSSKFYLKDTFEILRDVLMNDFDLCYDHRNDPTSNHCGTTPCPRSDYTCRMFSTFHGNVHFDTTGRNTANTGYIGQIQPNGSSYTYDLNYPHELAQCTRPGFKCSIENNYTDCSCNREFPAIWKWNPIFVFIYLSLSSIIKFIPIFVLELLMLIILIIMNFVTYKKYRRNSFQLWSLEYRYSLIFYSISTVGILFLFIKPSIFSCNVYIVLTDTGLYLMFCCFDLTSEKYTQTLETKLQSKHRLIIKILHIYLLSILLQTFNKLQINVVTVYNNITPYYFYYCNYNVSSTIVLGASISYGVVCLYFCLKYSYYRKNPFLFCVEFPSLLYMIFMSSMFIYYRINVVYNDYNTKVSIVLIHFFYGILQLILMVLQRYKIPAKEFPQIFPRKKLKKSVITKFQTSITDPLFKTFIQQYFNNVNQYNVIKLVDVSNKYQQMVNKAERAKFGSTIITQYCQPGSPTFLNILPVDTVKQLESQIRSAENDELEVINAKKLFDPIIQSLLSYYILNGFYDGFLYSKYYLEYEYYFVIESILRTLPVRVVHAFLECIEFVLTETKGLSDQQINSFVGLLRRNAQQKLLPPGEIKPARFPGANDNIRPPSTLHPVVMKPLK